MLIRTLSNKAELDSFISHSPNAIIVIGLKNSDVTREILQSISDYGLTHPEWFCGFMSYDDNKLLSIEYNIRIIPNLDVYKSGIFVKRINGATNEEDLFFQLNSL